ncbi:hypothetical protein CHLNCDRAFT_50601 [Chlorella variabilis]|uniref:Uncharacterized protein n=1 Tax=Chlorella variabilis TaxID=554065 RepID=E1Z7N1_CHLVA|nr:hypothetical protein CHLNCDRAFT_50601 [Chlorella variabilis]EFN58199.1 hypothetical protein CHLNCDRAFT_50601 [Chlorella variabilis]|eukprot:XP_005850301.1 hypothetical protein CHLNCDRAFT_50601 [Chlorella variabilis]
MSACVAAAQSTLLAAAQCQQATQQRNVRATASVGAAKRMLLPKHRHNIGMSRSSSRSLVVAAAAQAEGVGKLISKVEIPAFIPRSDLVDQLLRWAMIEIQENGVANVSTPCKVSVFKRGDDLWGFTVSFLKDGVSAADVRVAFDEETTQKHDWVGRGAGLLPHGMPVMEGNAEEIMGKHFEIRKVCDRAINDNQRESIRDFCNLLISAGAKYNRILSGGSYQLRGLQELEDGNSWQQARARQDKSARKRSIPGRVDQSMSKGRGRRVAAVPASPWAGGVESCGCLVLAMLACPESPPEFENEDAAVEFYLRQYAEIKARSKCVSAQAAQIVAELAAARRAEEGQQKEAAQAAAVVEAQLETATPPEFEDEDAAVEFYLRHCAEIEASNKRGEQKQKEAAARRAAEEQQLKLAAHAAAVLEAQRVAARVAHRPVLGTPRICAPIFCRIGATRPVSVVHKLHFPVLTSSFRPLFDLPDAPTPSKKAFLSRGLKVKVGKSLHKLHFPVLTSSFRPLFDLPDAPSAVPPTSSEWVPGRPVKGKGKGKGTSSNPSRDTSWDFASRHLRGGIWAADGCPADRHGACKTEPPRDAIGGQIFLALDSRQG